MKNSASEQDIQAVSAKIKELKLTPLPVPGPSRVAICVTGNTKAIERAHFTHLAGVKEVIRVTKPYKLVSRETQIDDSVIQIQDVKIGGNQTPVLMSGPCSVETLETTLQIAQKAKENGAQIFRAGAFKPRTSPYSFQGLGPDGLKILDTVRKEVGIPVVTEVIDTDTLDLVCDHVDILQIGTRNMYNYSLLKKVGNLNKPVVLKRGLSATLEEWLNAAEYIMMNGNKNIILCERGIRTFSGHSRNTLDINIIPVLKEETHLPVIVDPSHGIGKRNHIRALSRACLAIGADGLIIESHIDPNNAYSDGAQTITTETLGQIHKDLQILCQLS